MKLQSGKAFGLLVLSMVMTTLAHASSITSYGLGGLLTSTPADAGAHITDETRIFAQALNPAMPGFVVEHGSSQWAYVSSDETLTMLTTYSATLSTDITDLSGDPLNASYNWSFTAADGILSTAAESVQNDSSVSVIEPRIAYSDDGKAISVWHTLNLSTFKRQVLASHYTASGGWGTPFLLQADPDVNVEYPRLAGDGEGNAMHSLSGRSPAQECGFVGTSAPPTPGKTLKESAPKSTRQVRFGSALTLTARRWPCGFRDRE